MKHPNYVQVRCWSLVPPLPCAASSQEYRGPQGTVAGGKFTGKQEGRTTSCQWELRSCSGCTQGSPAGARSSCGCSPQSPRCSHWGVFLTLPPAQHPAPPPGWWSAHLGRRILSWRCCLPSSRWHRTGRAPCSPAACSASWGSGQTSALIWLVEASQLLPILSPHLCRAEANWMSSLSFLISCSQAWSLSGRSHRKTWRSGCKNTHCCYSSPCCGTQCSAWLGWCLHGPSSAWKQYDHS